jgi:D-3-phosphoglycerate dehydrogenase
MDNKIDHERKILVSPSSFGQCGEEPLSILRNEGFHPVVNPYGRKLNEDETIGLGRGCVGIVAGVETINRKVIEALDGLKCISRVGVGMDNIDLDYAKGKGIVVCNTPDGPKQAVAELTLGLSFNLLRKISIADRNIRAGIWKKEIGSLLSGKKIGVLGLGRIGKSVARLFELLGNEIYASDVNPDKTWSDRHMVKMVDIETLFSQCDLISIHLPGNSSEDPIVGIELLRKMKPTAYLINVARGGVVDEEALYVCLKDQKIAGAAVDVFHEEPYSGKFKTLDNMILTPHLGSYAKEGKLQMEIDAVKNLLKLLAQR